jgi:tetratricopeptide (TPR) repeat protein
MHRALLALRRGNRTAARADMERAAIAGVPLAMTNLALLLLDDGKRDAALDWSRRAVALLPIYPNGHRVHGKVALAVGSAEEARAAFARAATLEPHNLENRFNLALALIALGRHSEARAELTACLSHPVLAHRARVELARLPP